MTYYIIEIQTAAGGNTAYLVHTATDEDPGAARMKAESTYHTVLAAAALSSLACHAAVLVAADGTPVLHQCYRHEAAEAAEE